MTVGQRIERARKAKGWSLQGLADRMGVSRQLVWQWERDETDPRKHAERLCTTLGLPYEHFFDGAAPSVGLDAKIRRLSPSNRAAIEAAIDALLAQQHPPPKRAVK